MMKYFLTCTLQCDIKSGPYLRVTDDPNVPAVTSKKTTDSCPSVKLYEFDVNDIWAA